MDLNVSAPWGCLFVQDLIKQPDQGNLIVMRPKSTGVWSIPHWDMAYLISNTWFIHMKHIRFYTYLCLMHIDMVLSH